VSGVQPDGRWPAGSWRILGHSCNVRHPNDGRHVHPGRALRRHHAGKPTPRFLLPQMHGTAVPPAAGNLHFVATVRAVLCVLCGTPAAERMQCVQPIDKLTCRPTGSCRNAGAVSPVYASAQVLWSPDGNFLYTGARRDGDVICWDVRGSLEPLYRMQRDTRSTNQRIQFSIEPCGRHLATGAAQGECASSARLRGCSWRRCLSTPPYQQSSALVLMAC